MSGHDDTKLVVSGRDLPGRGEQDQRFSFTADATGQAIDIPSAAHTVDGIDYALLQHLTQDNVALVFRRRLKGKLLYAHAWGHWLAWDGSRWAKELTGAAFNFAREISREMNQEGKTGPSSAPFCRGVESFARTDRAFAVHGDEFDAKNYLLNTPAGTIDLRTNVMHQHAPSDRITKLTAASPTSEGGERFLRFLSEITAADESLVRFLQVSLGACLSGAVENHWLMFWVGGGRNGKSTLADLVLHVLGDYARKVSSELLMSRPFPSHPTEVANLQGVRIALSSEVRDGDHFDEARLNEFTGDTYLSARFMRGDFFDFARTHKHLLLGNHRPQLRTATDALKARLKIVPFRQSFAGKEDATLSEKLRKESGFVLNWLLQGHAAWLDAGRKLPQCRLVEEETVDYFESQSTVDAWLQERVVKIDDDGRSGREWLKSSRLFHDYQTWKESRGEQPVSQTRWSETMTKTFRKRNADGVRYVGALLKPDGGSDGF